MFQNEDVEYEMNKEKPDIEEEMIIGNVLTHSISENNIMLMVELNDVLTYALLQNGIKLVRDVCIKNISQNVINDLMLKVKSDIDLVIPFEQGIQSLQAGEELHLRDLNVLIKGDYLASLTERVVCNLQVYLCKGEEVISSDSKEITILAYDEWPGLKYFPDLLATFVTPNHPVIADLLQSTSKWLTKWTGQPSLEGYQCEDSNRIKNMAAAAYAAIQEKNITYANPPSSFEAVGQRVRLCDTIMEQHLGTCFDITLLYASVLEAIGLNPILVLVKGHIFAGVWLVDESFSDPVIDDPSQLEKRMATGIRELLVVECTAMCSGKTNNFDLAIQIAEKKVSNYSDFIFAIDVLRARRSGIRPLPMRIKTVDGYVIKHEERKDNDITEKPEDIGYIFDKKELDGTNKVTKQIQWERKLLDMSMRNMLINMRLTKAVVPLLTADVEGLENALADGEEFQLKPRPVEWDLSNVNVFTAETTNDLGPYKDLIALECKHKRLPTVYTEKELNGTLTKMYRSAKMSLEENGASTLYLALGLIRWFEKKSGEQPARYAPIVLIPIEIIRKSASKGYVMYMRDEDAQVNITLLEFLKQNYGIVIGGLSPIPTDEHGIDVRKIFATIRHAIMNEKMWDVIEAGFIGNFSFSQFVMWNDIHSKKDFLSRNKIVRGLMKGGVDWDCTIPKNVDTDEAYLPITADASQIRAINMAANDVSFVLHGPPGTGKSQTITAMIANAMAKGKSVLFVAEKKAALEVVQKRLSALGISDFCLELHSNKATKKAVLDQLKKGLEIGVWGTKTDYENKISDIRKMRADLDSYVKTLHVRRPFGKSLRELIDIYEMIPCNEIEVLFNKDYAGSLTENQLDNQKHILERLIAAGRGVGHPSGHPLSAVGQTTYTQSLKVELNSAIQSYKESLVIYKEEVERFTKMIVIDEPMSKDDWENIQQYANSIISSEVIPSFLMGIESVDAEFATPLLYLQKKEKLSEKESMLFHNWNPDFLRMDMEVFHSRYEAAGKRLFGKSKALSSLRDEIQAYASFNVAIEKIPVILTDITFYKKEKEEVESDKNNLSDNWKVLVSRHCSVQLFSEYQQKMKGQLAVVAQFSEQIKVMESENTLKYCIQTAKKVLSDLNHLNKKERIAEELLNLDCDTEASNWIQGKMELCDKILDNSSIIKDWIAYKNISQEASDAGLGLICEVYESGIPHDEVMDVYLKSVYKSIVLHTIEQEPTLNGFTGTGFNERIAQFKKLDQDFMDLTKDEMYYTLTHQLPTAYEAVEISKELNILRRAISSNGRGMSIRFLFDQIPNVLRRLCPCILMSPISVAQYLSADNKPVDIVIFDEASQLPTCKAIGVLARGKNAVIVGDPNQMPPTSFFAGNTVDEDNLDIEDLDSILDDCLALGMPQSHLKWHYRSRHESLIAFSNHEFYENQMLTFPSVNDREKRVSLVKVDGFFDRGKGRVNQSEADAIVKEIKRRFIDPELRNESIGVVTFNISQQTLIQDMLQEEYQKDADLDTWANNGEEDVFVKNLENVQGDERDVILFSIAFGPDSEGKTSMNFGPLNKDGGWKRLNVAVSRARNEMIVFSTLTADLINLRRTKAKGVEALKDFLEYAQKGELQVTYSEGRIKKNQGIMDRICMELTKAGYGYQKTVGHSNFKVDIAVINPYNEDEYLLGIMLDGDSYSQSINTKDREVSQIGVLKDLGWELIRIWTMDWWDNSDKEISKILQLVEEKKYDKKPKDFTSYVAVKEMVKTASESSTGNQQVDGNVSDKAEEITGQTLLNQKHSLIPVNEEKETTNKSVIQAFGEVSKFTVENSSVGHLDKVAGRPQEESAVAIQEEILKTEYEIIEYKLAKVTVTPLSTSDYILKSSLNQIANKIFEIIEIEAPISFELLLKKTLRAFDISRSSAQTIEATERAIKKVSTRSNRQNGVKFYWKEDQDPETYNLYRIDGNSEDKRSMTDICQEELKNAICKTIQEKGPLLKDDIVKETIRTMGFARSGVALNDAVDRGLKYGRKKGVIVQNSEKRFSLIN